MSLRVAVIGSGFSGVAVVCQLLPRLPAGSTIALINTSGRLARGLAYGTQSNEHVLNVPAARMSMHPGRTSHFVDWLQAVRPQAQGHDFVSRRLYGDYLEASLEAEARAAIGRVSLESRTDTALGIEALRDGRFEIHFGVGPASHADRVILALGHFKPKAPHPSLARLQPEAYFNDPWDVKALQGVDPETPLALIGSGLTMLDLCMSLQRRGHRGQVLALSRRGLLPQGHRSNELPPSEFSLSASLKPGSGNLREMMRMFRSEVRRAQAAGKDWRDVWASFRPQTADHWRALSLKERAQFLRHVQPYWDVHRHRAAPEAMGQLQRAIASGQWQLRAGRVLDAEPTGERIRLHWRARGSEARCRFDAARLINCSGPGSRIDADSSPLLWSLQQRGMLQGCPLGLGLHVDTHHRLLDRQGRPQPGLFYVGPLLKAQYWEATAVPELREHALAVAMACLSEA